jgi:hypothetical protein
MIKGDAGLAEKRFWLAFELSIDYVACSAFRFLDKQNPPVEMRQIFNRIKAGENVDLTEYLTQRDFSMDAAAPVAVTFPNYRSID